jgi:hypothetical protein
VGGKEEESNQDGDSSVQTCECTYGEMSFPRGPRLPDAHISVTERKF